MRLAALVLLLVLYGTSVTEHDPGAPLLRGFVLLALVGAWLWLPRLSRREALTGAVVVATVGILAVPVAASFDAERPWWNYREWNLFGDGRAVTFDWTHSYGPLDWPRDGTTLLNIESDRPQYWKVETLDGFDGFRWLRTDESSPTQDLPGLPATRKREGRSWNYFEYNPRWDEQFRVTVRSLSSQFVVGAGITYRVDGAGLTFSSQDGTTIRANDGRSSAATPTPCGPTRRTRLRRRCAGRRATRRSRCSSSRPSRCPGEARAPSTAGRSRRWPPRGGRRCRCPCETARRASTRTWTTRSSALATPAPTASPSGSPAASRPPTTRSSPSRTTCSATCATASARPARRFRSTPSCSRTRSATASSSPARWR